MKKMAFSGQFSKAMCLAFKAMPCQLHAENRVNLTIVNCMSLRGLHNAMNGCLKFITATSESGCFEQFVE